MEISVVSDAISSISYSTQSLGFSNLLLKRPYKVFSLSDSSSDQPQQSPPPFHVSAASPPPTRTLTRRRLRNSRRVKRKTTIGNDGGENIFFGSSGGDFNSSNGYFGSGGGSGGWNFGGYGGSNWEEFPDNTVSDPAFDFVYGILCWIALSNCLHFSFKKVVRILSDGFGDREKVPLQLTTVC